MDNGVRNYFIRYFNPPHLRGDTPFLFEAFCLSEFIKNGINPIKIRYWRTKSKTEVDFIIEDSGKLIPIEVKYKNSLKKSDFKGLHNFHRNYPNSEKGYLISKSIQQEIDDFKISTPFLIKTFFELKR